MYYIYVCSFNKLKEYFSCFTLNFNIIILTETWLKENDFFKFILNIIVFSSSIVCNLKKRGGGVVILVNKCIIIIINV